MANLSRALQKLFCNDVSAAGNVAQFGSLAAAAPTFSKDPAVIQALGAFTQGWQSATVGNQSPALEDFNGLLYLLTYQIAYVLQKGVPQWISGEVYYTNSMAQSGGVIFVSLVDNNTSAVTDTNKWSPLIPRERQALAWVYFDGTAGGFSILNSYNISGGSRDGAGAYTFSFQNDMANTNYVIVANGTADGAVPYYQRGQFLTEFVDASGTQVKTTTSFGIAAGSESDSAEDTYRGYVVIYGN